ncbi:hypothetical protein AXF42_Ash018484 [Apostasia shenzhenica]|uniref:Importin N-terminal domain-containing protein n=1 Tax=Apostasia shenzhenica TaxID=1088818 RepID=A0A2H9ZZI3_9ASPA|nr:hypothetical protein AXF42_Ash018484 [Apostasia shenzhenica]
MAAEKLRDLSKPIDVPLLDATVSAFYGTGSKEERTAADQILRELQNNPDMWLQVVHILQNSQNLNTKFFALQVLEGVIKYRWNALPIEQRDGIKNYISDLIVQLSSNEVSFRREKLYVNKLNIILVQVLKHEWPARWQSFIPDLVTAAKSSETISSQRTELIRATLATLHAFLSWIPLGYIFESPLLETLLKSFPVPSYRNLTLQCLTEVAALHFGDFYDIQYVKMYTIFMVQLQTILPPGTNIPDAYANGSGEEQAFILNLALFFTSFFKSHIQVLETTDENKAALLMGLEYLIGISYVDETEVFKVCLDYWNLLVLQLFEAHNTLENPAVAATIFGLQAPGMIAGTGSQVLQRRQLYSAPLSKLRMLMISRMAKPEEVLIVEDENGNIVRETMKDNDVLVQYKIMRETLIYLTHLDHDDTEQQMLKKLSKQLSGEDWTWNNLNTLCWAIGSISGSMMEEQDMACDTFLKIVQKCKRKFVITQVGENEPFLCELLSSLASTIADLEPHQIHTFYEAVGCMIQAEPDPARRDEYLKRSVKRETLKLIETFVDKAEDQSQLGKQFVPPMMDPILADYARNVPDARESEVLSLFATIINKYKGSMVDDVPRIFEAVFQCTLEMITRNFEDYPEHRLKFFSLLRAIATHCFQALVQLSTQQVKIVMDSIIWAFRHTERNIAETGLNLLLELLKNYQVDSSYLTEPLWDASSVPYPFPNNTAFVRDYTIKLLGTSFPNMTLAEVTQFVDGLFESRLDIHAFKNHIRDFLVQSKEFSAQDNKELYAEEAALQREKERQRMLSIPGLVAPSELQDEMVDS